MGERKGKYIPRHLLSAEQREKERAKDRCQYARSQIGAGYGYTPMHDLKKDVGYGMPIGAVYAAERKGQELEGTPHTAEEREAVMREVLEKIEKKKEQEARHGEGREERGSPFEEDKYDWDTILAQVPEHLVHPELFVGPPRPAHLKEVE